MAKGKKTGGKDFTPGVSGNPQGRPKESPNIRELLKEKRVEFIQETHKLFQMSGPDVDAISQDSSVPMLTALIARTMSIAFNKGCKDRFEFLVNNSMAALPKSVELSDSDGKPIRPLAEVPTEKLLEFFEALASKKSD